MNRRVQPIDPLYVISKKRWKHPYTIRALQAINADFLLVVEPHEAEYYAPLVEPDQLLILPFRDRGTSVYARNFVRDHAERQGASFHWILDDNIAGFSVYTNPYAWRATDISPFNDISRFARLFANLGISGMQYDMFAHTGNVYRPNVIFNTRIYSCLLINHAMPLRWRGVYNEDTDLSLRALKSGWATALWYRYLADKLRTMTIPGGNTDTLYADRMRGRYRMALSLARQHPDVARIGYRWNRPQHVVDYRPLRHVPLRLAPGVTEEDVRSWTPTAQRFWTISDDAYGSPDETTQVDS